MRPTNEQQEEEEEEFACVATARVRYGKRRDGRERLLSRGWLAAKFCASFGL